MRKKIPEEGTTGAEYHFVGLKGTPRLMRRLYKLRYVTLQKMPICNYYLGGKLNT